MGIIVLSRVVCTISDNELMNIHVGSYAPTTQANMINQVGGQKTSIISMIDSASNGLIYLRMGVRSSVPYLTSRKLVFMNNLVPQKVTESVSGSPLLPINSGRAIYS